MERPVDHWYYRGEKCEGAQRQSFKRNQRMGSAHCEKAGAQLLRSKLFELLAEQVEESMMPTFYMSRQCRMTLLLCLLKGITTGVCAASTYYVSTAGSDSNAGTQAAPFRNVSKGVAQASNPGDTVIVMDGTYSNEGVVYPSNGVAVATFQHSGTSGNPITVRAQNRGAAILDGGNTNTSSTCNGTYAYFDLFNASFIVIQGFVIQHTCEEGIHSNDSAHDIVIKWNELRYIANHLAASTDQIGKDGIYLNPACYNFTFDGNVFHDIGRTGFEGSTSLLRHFDHGIYTHGNSNVTIINNIFYNMSAGYPIQLHGSTGSGYLIANNTFALDNLNTGESGQIALWGDEGFSGPVVAENNVFYQPTGSVFNVYLVSSLSCTFDHNLIYPVVGTGLSACNSTHQVTSNPNFMATGTPYNFQVQAGSPAIDAGINVPQVPDDFAGTARPQGSSTDIGAYEYISVSGQPCDLNGDGVVDRTDVQIAINSALGLQACGNADLDGDGSCNIIDVQRVIDAEIGGVCRVGP